MKRVGSSLSYLRCKQYNHYQIHPSSSVYVRPLGSSLAYFTAVTKPISAAESSEVDIHRTLELGN
ncbi:hypothetical protein DVH24_019690 [Malus domestica]|uniref:Uncharacterized protein n=1 Tax=Malus domestica TaxID=3750 RepID=A0A498I3I2_MALDO|nr:hypothetical protein DVH24_019690 [Malus domestica]